LTPIAEAVNQNPAKMPWNFREGKLEARREIPQRGLMPRLSKRSARAGQGAVRLLEDGQPISPGII
jgi:hypothetical protein